MNKIDFITTNNSSIKTMPQTFAVSNVQFRGRFKPVVDTLQLSTKNKNVVNKLKLAFTGFISTLGSLFLNKSQKVEETKEQVSENNINPIQENKIKQVEEENNNGYIIPKPLEGTSLITVNNCHQAIEAKFYKEGNEDYAIICGDKFKVDFLDKNEALKRKIVNDIYNKAELAEPNYIIEKSDSEYAILTLVENNEPISVLDKVNREYNLNFFSDDFELEDDFIIFNKNGKETKIEILEDDDTRLTQETADKIYISRSEYLFSLRKLTELKNNALIESSFSDLNGSQQLEFSRPYFNAKKKLQKEYHRLTESAKTSKHVKIDKVIQEGIAKIEFDSAYEKQFDAKVKPIRTQKKHHIYDNVIFSNPNLKKYIMEMDRNSCITIDGAREATSCVKNGKYVKFDEIRAAAYTRIFQEKRSLSGEEFKNLSYIPTKFIASIVFGSNITSIDLIETLWIKNVIRLTSQMKLKKSTEHQMSKFTEYNIAQYCVDEYGEICDYKVNLAKTLLSKSKTFAEATAEPQDFKPATDVSKIIELCNTKEQADDIINNILPLLEENGIEYEADKSRYDIITLLNTPPKERKNKIDIIKYLRKECVEFIDYNTTLNYKNLKNFKSNHFCDLEYGALIRIAQKAEILPFKNLNKEIVSFIHYLEGLEDRGCKAYVLINAFLDGYKSACLENDYEAKKEIIGKINKYLRIAEYFIENNALLATEATTVTSEMVKQELQGKMRNALDIIDLVGETTTKHLIERKYKGLRQYLELAKSLVCLHDDQKELIKTKLAQLPHPEQRLGKLEALMPLIDRISREDFNALVELIKPPTVTPEQKTKIEQIFSTDKDYSEQINDFVKEFNVPKENEDTIRKFLEKEKLNEKFIIPQSADEQIKIINKKIASIQNNDKIPEDKKQKYLKQLAEQKAQIKSNPGDFTKPRLNDRAIKLLEAQIEAHINLINNNKEFSKNIRQEFYKAFKINVSPELTEKLEYDSKYMSKMFVAMTDKDFIHTFNELLSLLEEDPSKKLTELLYKIPENALTRLDFEEQSLDYDEWLKFDENSYKALSITVEGGVALEACRKNFLDEIYSPLAQRLDEDIMYKLRNILAYSNVKKANALGMLNIIEKFEKEFETNDYWKQDNPDIKNFKAHMAIHKKNFNDLKKIKKQTYNLKVRLWDKNDISRNLGFGNHVGCCTSIGKFNQYVAPQHLTNSFINGMEIVDDAGNSYGNSMCYFAMVDDQLHLVIDSFEVDGNLSASEEVTNAIILYAKEVCARMGRPDAKVIFGPYFNKINSERLFRTPGHTMKVIGSAPSWTYIDALEGKCDINQEKNSLVLSEIMY